MKMNTAFGWFWPLLKFFLFEWRFADRPWNVVILLGFQVPVPYLDLIFGICDTSRCEITWTIISGSMLVFAVFREKHCVLFSVLRILPEWRWCWWGGPEIKSHKLKTRVKLAVTSPSRHFRDLAKKTPTEKRADKLKKYSKKHIMAKS